jgi:hypothetical protein
LEERQHPLKLFSKFYSGLCSDKVDWDASVEGFFAIVEKRECRKLLQSHIASPGFDRKDKLRELLVYLKVFCKSLHIFITITLFVLTNILSTRLKEETRLM